MILIDYEEFLHRRFDMLIRYHLLYKVDFNVARATELVLSREYNFLARASGEIIKQDIDNLPVVAKKMEKAMRMYNSPIGEVVVFYLFSQRKYSWLEKTIKKNPAWMKKCPYPVNEYGQSGSIKRFLVALKYNRPLYWELEERKVPRPSRAIWREEEYEKLFSLKQYKKFLTTKKILLEHMKKLFFFSERFKVG